MSDAQGFPAFRAGSRRHRHTWWGTAWIRAMEDMAVDATLTRRGRRIAAEGRIGPITISRDSAGLVRKRKGVFHVMIPLPNWSLIHFDQTSAPLSNMNCTAPAFWWPFQVAVKPTGL